MGTEFKCGCRVSGGWFLCKKHEDNLVFLIAKEELKIDNTISDVIRNKKGKIKKFVNERPMESAR